MRYLHKWLFGFLCLFAIASFISIAGGNVFLGLSTLLFVVLLVKNKGTDIFYDDKHYFKAIAVFAGALFVSALCSDNIGYGLKFWADFFVWRFMPFIIVLFLFVIKEKVNKLLNLVICGFTITSLYVIYKGIFVYSWDISYGGASGFVGHPMTFAGWTCILLPVLYALLHKDDLPKNLQLMYGICFCIGCVASFFNATRGAWLALVIVLFAECILLSLKNKKLILFLVCIVLVMGMILVDNSSFMKRASSIIDMKNTSNISRLVMLDTALTMFKNQPILGVGLGQYKSVYQDVYMKPKLEQKRETIKNLPGFDKLDSFEQELILSSKANIWEIKGLKKLKQSDRRKIRSEYLKQADINEYENLSFLNHLAKLGHAHSNIFQMLAENGMVGLSGYIFAFGYILWTNIKNYFTNRNPYALMIAASTSALLLQGLTEYNFGNGAVMKIYWLVLACLIVLVREYNKETL